MRLHRRRRGTGWWETERRRKRRGCHRGRLDRRRRSGRHGWSSRRSRSGYGGCCRCGGRCGRLVGRWRESGHLRRGRGLGRRGDLRRGRVPRLSRQGEIERHSLGLAGLNSAGSRRSAPSGLRDDLGRRRRRGNRRRRLVSDGARQRNPGRRTADRGWGGLHWTARRRRLGRRGRFGRRDVRTGGRDRERHRGGAGRRCRRVPGGRGRGSRAWRRRNRWSGCNERGLPGEGIGSARRAFRLRRSSAVGRHGCAGRQRGLRDPPRGNRRRRGLLGCRRNVGRRRQVRDSLCRRSGLLLGSGILRRGGSPRIAGKRRQQVVPTGALARSAGGQAKIEDGERTARYAAVTKPRCRRDWTNLVLMFRDREAISPPVATSNHANLVIRTDRPIPAALARRHGRKTGKRAAPSGQGRRIGSGP